MRVLWTRSLSAMTSVTLEIAEEAGMVTARSSNLCRLRNACIGDPRTVKLSARNRDSLRRVGITLGFLSRGSDGVAQERPACEWSVTGVACENQDRLELNAR